MHSWIKRGEFVFSFSVSCIIALLPIIALSNFALRDTSPSIRLTVHKLLLYALLFLTFSSRGPEDYYVPKVIDSPDIVMSLDADFSPLFHWNTKQLYVYIALEYANGKHPRNQLIIWDKIVGSSESHHLKLDTFSNKYRIADITRDF